MPCYTVRTITQDLTVADRSALVRGLTAAGFKVTEQGDAIRVVNRDGVTATIANGQIQTRDASIINEVKRAYSREAVRTAAKKYGWLVQQDRRDTNRYTVGRRS